ncbi:MAG: YARHG domain-containing protein [Clostridia bacterium]|nr:YARHG domain-containing protein [Clostridia bacterium]
MKTGTDKEKHGVRRKKALMWISVGIVLGLSALIAVASAVRGHKTVIDLQNYVNVGTDAGGNPAGLLDVDAILTDLHLPKQARRKRGRTRYPDVYALCTAKMYLYKIDADHVRVTVEADVDTLGRYGITFLKTTWEQQMKGFVEGATPTPIPLPPETTPAPAASQKPADPDGYLTSLVDAKGNGLNLRAVCEAVQKERDDLCKEIFGNNYDTTKTQVAFIVFTSGRYANVYRASYSVTYKPEDGSEPPPGSTLWFTVDVYNLRRTEGKILFDGTDVTICASEEESKRLPSNGKAIKLWGGGVRADGKDGFDLNGFVKFPEQPTSYRLANGVYWSPTYDRLDEDMVWSLTAVNGHSMANLLRYARKEIYARYYMAFDPKTEREFKEHYESYDWYEPKDPDLSRLMTEAERQNIRLLREIQSLIEK